ncbi:DinB family protein [Niabella aquatica]
MNNLSQQLAQQFTDVHQTKDWVSTTSLKLQLSDVSWEEANKKIGNHNSIAVLAFHLNYYISGINRVLEGNPLDIKDKFSFDAPKIANDESWQTLLKKLDDDAARFSALVGQKPQEYWEQPFANLNYGSNYHNINAMIQHIYYHLGQIVLLKKLLRDKKT